MIGDQMGRNGMNGQHAQTQQPPAGFTEHTTVAVYQPVPITPAAIVSAIKWLAGGICAVIVTLNASGWLFVPAKQTELHALTQTVQAISQTMVALQTAQKDGQVAVERLTLAVDNLSGIVDGLVNRPAQAARAAVPKVKR